MPSKNPQFNVRVSPEQLERWRVAADASGDSLNAWAVNALEAAARFPVHVPASSPKPLSGSRRVQAVNVLSSVPEALPRPRRLSGSARTAMCEHRIPAGAFCKRCDSVG